MFLKLLGDFVRKKRKELNLTQDQLAERIDKDQAYIYRLESGKQVGSIPTLIDVALAIETRPGQLLDILAGVNESETKLEEGRFITLPKYFSQEDTAFVESLVNFITATYERGGKRPVINIIQGNPKELEPQILGRPGDRKPDPWDDLNEKYRQEFKDQIEEWLSRQNIA